MPRLLVFVGAELEDRPGYRPSLGTGVRPEARCLTRAGRGGVRGFAENVAVVMSPIGYI